MNKQTVILLVSLIFAIQAIVFAYFYATHRNPGRLLGNSGVAGVLAPGAPVPLFGIYGDNSVGGLDKPMAVSVYDNKIFVSDTNNRRIVVFDYNGNPLYTFGKYGAGQGEFQFPYGITVDDSGLIYVADIISGKISVFDQTGKFIKYFAQSDERVFGKPAGLFYFDNQVFVTDIEQNKTMAFSLDGQKVLEFGKSGNGDGDFSSPNAITVTKEYIYVSDTGNHRVEKFDRTGKFIRSITGSGAVQQQSGFVNNRGVAVDGRGTLFVVSNLTNKIWGFDKDEKKAFEPVGQLGIEDDQFCQPNGMFIDPQGRIYITDSGNGRVMVYQN